MRREEFVLCVVTPKGANVRVLSDSADTFSGSTRSCVHVHFGMRCVLQADTSHMARAPIGTTMPFQYNSSATPPRNEAPSDSSQRANSGRFSTHALPGPANTATTRLRLVCATSKIVALCSASATSHFYQDNSSLTYASRL